MALLLGLPIAAFAQGPTYSGDIEPIIQAKCHICHREGDVAPFVLDTYDDAVTWAADTQTVLNNGSMPPWKPVAGYGEFQNSYALTDAEKQTFLTWIANGTPRGELTHERDRNTQIETWPLGPPNIVLTPPLAFTPAPGKDIYRCFVMPETGLGQTTYLSAIDVKPGATQIVHHVLIFVDTTGTAVNLDGQDGSAGYDCFGGPGFPIVDTTSITTALATLSLLGGWAPGQRTQFLPAGIGLQLPINGRVVMQVHYSPIGRSSPDQTSLGLYIATTTIQKRLYWIPVLNTDFTIPANTVTTVTAEFPPTPLPLAAQAINIFPHMHLLGRQIKVDLLDQNNNLIAPMIYENNWDFNWQGAYTYVSPVAIPNYSKVRVTCTFDNTANNPKNPNNPIVAVSFGENTTDEMCLAFVGLTLDNDPFTVLNNFNLQ